MEIPKGPHTGRERWAFRWSRTASCRLAVKMVIEPIFEAKFLGGQLRLSAGARAPRTRCAAPTAAQGRLHANRGRRPRRLASEASRGRPLMEEVGAREISESRKVLGLVRKFVEAEVMEGMRDGGSRSGAREARCPVAAAGEHLPAPLRRGDDPSRISTGQVRRRFRDLVQDGTPGGRSGSGEGAGQTLASMERAPTIHPEKTRIVDSGRARRGSSSSASEFDIADGTGATPELVEAEDARRDTRQDPTQPWERRCGRSSASLNPTLGRAGTPTSDAGKLVDGLHGHRGDLHAPQVANHPAQVSEAPRDLPGDGKTASTREPATLRNLACSP